MERKGAVSRTFCVPLMKLKLFMPCIPLVRVVPTIVQLEGVDDLHVPISV